MSGIETVHIDARAALRARLKTCPGLPAARAWEGFTFDPTVGVPFIEDKLAALDDDPKALGVIQHDMSYTLTLKFPSNEGTADIEALAGALLKHFKVGSRLTRDTTSLVCMKARRVGALLQETDWIICTVQVLITAFTLD